jgi:hypothetical protein
MVRSRCRWSADWIRPRQRRVTALAYRAGVPAQRREQPDPVGVRFGEDDFAEVAGVGHTPAAQTRRACQALILAGFADSYSSWSTVRLAEHDASAVTFVPSIASITGRSTPGRLTSTESR